MTKKEIIEKAYSLIGTQTPLDINCGTLCKEACCRGEGDSGMYLFPGEELLFPRRKDAWYRLTKTRNKLSTGYTVSLLTCKGTCPRNERPLSCRLFPLMAYLTEEDFVELRLDPKALSICPLTRDIELYPIEESYIDALYDALEVLLEDREVIEFIRLLSDDYDTTGKLLLS